MGFLEVFAVRPLALEEVGHGIETEAVEPKIEPEAYGGKHLLLDLGVVVVEVGLMREEAMPVERTCILIPGPVRLLAVDKDHSSLFVPVVCVGPHVPVAFRRGGFSGFLEPGMLVGGVIHDQVCYDPKVSFVCLLEERHEVVEVPVFGEDRVEVRDVVAAVFER
jgi:hypothetical protein